MFVDFNRTETEELIGKNFMLDNSLHTFRVAKFRNVDLYLYDVDDCCVYDMFDIINGEFPFCFYKNENDEDYLGVWVEE